VHFTDEETEAQEGSRAQDKPGSMTFSLTKGSGEKLIWQIEPQGILHFLEVPGRVHGGSGVISLQGGHPGRE
jgi:hypothetical protein